MNGYLPQTVAVAVEQPDASEVTYESEPAKFTPNPIQVALQMAPPPPKPPVRKKRHKAVAKPRTASTNVFPAPPQRQPAATQPFSSAPPIQARSPSASPFPPPPTFASPPPR
jgi:hypothetical protein